MTQQMIDAIRNARSHLYSMDARHAREKESARKNLAKLQDACDHRHPDGTSAIEGNMFYLGCKICHQNDM